MEAPLVQVQPLAMRHVDGADRYRIGAHVVRRSPRLGCRIRSSISSPRMPAERRGEQLRVYRWNASVASKSGRAVRLTCAPSRSRKSASASMCAVVSASVSCPGSLDQTAMRRSARRMARGGGSVDAADVQHRIGAGDHVQRQRQVLAERASGPITAMSVTDATGASDWPRPEHSPQLGLWPNTPQ